jgi:deferrochelatase/peroxidase EfeB
VRRTNPRDSLPPDPEESLKFADRHLIIRRGMPYGEPLFPLMELPPDPNIEDDGGERGLMFLCINANIARQFEFVQQSWVENTKFHGLYNDKDPLVGGCDDVTDHTIQHTPVRRKVKKLPRLVHVKGGGYFFMPSITALKRIAALS